jgi:hypothetical protein
LFAAVLKDAVDWQLIVTLLAVGACAAETVAVTGINWEAQAPVPA